MPSPLQSLETFHEIRSNAKSPYKIGQYEHNPKDSITYYVSMERMTYT